MRQAHTARNCLVVLLLLVLLAGCGAQGQLSPAPTSSMSDTPTAISSTPTGDPSVRLTPILHPVSWVEAPAIAVNTSHTRLSLN